MVAAKVSFWIVGRDGKILLRHDLNAIVEPLFSIVQLEIRKVSEKEFGDDRIVDNCVRPIVIFLEKLGKK